MAVDAAAGGKWAGLAVAAVVASGIAYGGSLATFEGLMDDNDEE